MNCEESAYFSPLQHRPYDCVTRLNDRQKFQDVYRLHHPQPQSVYEQFDLFAIADAYLKRGGYYTVKANNRQKEIQDSLSHLGLNQLTNIDKIYMANLMASQNRLKKDGQLLEKPQFQTATIEYFLLPHFIDSRYKQYGLHPFKIQQSPEPSQGSLMRSLKITHIDQFFCLRTLALSLKFEMAQLHKSYIHKYAAVCRYYLVNGYTLFQQPDQHLSKFLQLPKLLANFKILIVGAGIHNIRLANKFVSFGAQVTIIDRHADWKSDADLYEMSPTILWPFDQQYYHRELAALGIDIEFVPANSIQSYEEDLKGKFRLCQQIKSNLMEPVNVKRGAQKVQHKMTRKGEAELQHTQMLRLHGILRRGTLFQQIKNGNNKKINIIRSTFYKLAVTMGDVNQITLEVENEKRDKPRVFDILIYGLMYGVVEAKEKKDYCIPYLKDDKLISSLTHMPTIKQKVNICRIFNIQMNKDLSITFTSVEINSKKMGVIIINMHSLHPLPQNNVYYSHCATIQVIYYKHQYLSLTDNKQIEQLTYILRSVYFNGIQPSLYNIKHTKCSQINDYYFNQADRRVSDNRSLHRALEIHNALYLNIPLLHTKSTQRLASVLYNGNYIIKQILSRVVKAFDSSCDVSAYEQKVTEQTVVVKKPQTNFVLDFDVMRRVATKIFEKQPVIDGKHLFCLSHPLVENHFSFLRREAEMYGSNMLSKANYLLQLQKPIDLDSQRKLVDIGMMSEGGQTNIVSMRMGYSLAQIGAATFYWQCVLSPEGCIRSPAYAIIDQFQPYLVFWHYSLEKLTKFMSTKINQSKMLNYRTVQPEINCLFPAIIRNIIQKDIKQDKNPDILLEQRVKLLESQHRLLKPLFYTNRLQYLRIAIDNILESQSKLRNLRKLSFPQLLFGLYDPRYLLHRYFQLFRICRKTQMLQKVSILKYHLQHSQHRYAIDIHQITQSCYRMRRPFMSLYENNFRQFLIFTYEKKQLQNSPKKRMLSAVDHQTIYTITSNFHKQCQPQEFDSIDRCSDRILEKLLIVSPVGYILSEIHGLIVHELHKITKLDVQFTRLYEMEVKCKKNTVEDHMGNLEYMLLLEDETAETTQSKEQLRMMAKQEHIDVIEGNIFFSFQV